MPRIPQKDINYAEVGRWILDYWKKTQSADELEQKIKDKVLEAYSSASDAGDPPEVHVIFEEPGQFCVVIPQSPWENDPSCLRCAEVMDCYQRELGIVVYGGCR